MNNFEFQPELKVDFLTFSDGAEHVQLDPNSVYTSMDLYANLNSSQNIMRFFLLIEALNEVQKQDGHVGNLTVDMPYLPYARQDRHCAPGQSFALDVFMGLLSRAVYNCENLNIIFDVEDLHSDVALELAETWSLQFNHHTQLDAIKQDEEVKAFVQDCDVVISPDAGATNKSAEIANYLEIWHFASSKKRDPKTGYITKTDVHCSHAPEYVKDKNVLICDDICDGGMTFNLLADELKKYEPASINLLISHGIFSKGIDTLRENFDSLMVLNCMNDDLEDDEFLTIIS